MDSVNRTWGKPMENFVAAVFGVLFLGALHGPAFAQTLIDTCGQTYSGDGVLVSDLDCSTIPGAAVVITAKGSLDLAGFTVTAIDAVDCTASSSCTVRSSIAGGTLEGVGRFGSTPGSGSFGIAYAKHLEVSDITIRAFFRGVRGRGLLARNVVFESNGDPGSSIPGAAIDSAKSTLTIEDCTFSDNAQPIDGKPAAPNATTAIIRRSTFSGNHNGRHGLIETKKLIMEDSTVTGTMNSPAASFPSDAILAVSKAKIRNVQFDANDGTVSCAKRCQLEDVTFTNAVTEGAVAFSLEGKLRADRVTISGAVGTGFDGRGVKLRDSLITGVSGNGVNGGNVKVEDSIVSANGGAGVRATDRIGGVAGRSVGGKAVVKNSEITGNGVFGVVAEISTGFGSCSDQIRAKISDSVVAGNGTDADCGTTLACADAAGCNRVRISGSTMCETSYDMTSGFPGTNWGVCALD
jgi:hypothetical protein